MNWVDVAILVIIAVSAAISLVRGFMSEAVSLVGWILAFWVGLTFMDELAARFAGLISIPAIRLAAAFLILLISTLVLTAITNFLVGQLVDRTGLTGTDRMLGMIFGIARGVIVVAVLVLVAGLSTVPESSVWRESELMGYFQMLAVEIRGLLPPNVAAYFRY